MARELVIERVANNADVESGLRDEAMGLVRRYVDTRDIAENTLRHFFEVD